jgi:ATP-binding cassette subfamily B protein
MARFIRPYRRIVVLLVLTVVLPVAMELIVPRLLQYIIDEGIRVQDLRAITRGSSIMLGAALIGALATLGQGFCRAWLAQGLAFDMRNELFTHIQALSFSNLDKMHTGRLMTRISSDVDVVRMFTSAGLSLLMRTPSSCWPCCRSRPGSSGPYCGWRGRYSLWCSKSWPRSTP